jgi:hypothetical protein
MKSRRKQRLWSLENLETRCVLDSTVVFNELMYNPAVDESLEWIELHNQMAINVDISRWQLSDGVTYEFPVGTVVPGGGYLVIAANPDALSAAGIHTGALGPWTGTLNNGGEQVELRNNSDRVMDAIEYGDNAPWPLAADGSGVTLAKFDSLSASEPAANWRASLQLDGTPGGENFPTQQSVQLPNGVVSYWNFDEAFGPAIDRADSNDGLLAAGATRGPGLVGSGAVNFADSSAAYINVGAGNNNNFSVSTGVTVEAVLEPNWDSAGTATIFRKAPDTGAPLLSYWSFDETNGTPANANVLDSVGTNHGTLTGTAVHTTGIRGLGAGLFTNVSSQAVNLGSGLSATAGITISALIKPEWDGNLFSADSIYYKNDSSNRISLEFQRDAAALSADPPVSGQNPQVLSFALNTGGTVKELDMPLGVNLAALPNGTANAGRIYLTSPGGTLGPNDVVLKDGDAHHVAATYDVGTGEKAIWIDGIKRWFRQYDPGTPMIVGGTTNAAIGNQAPNLSRAFTGVIDEVAIWGDALLPSQIAALAANATPITVPTPNANNSIVLEFQNDGNNATANPPVAAGPVLSFGLNVGGVYSELDMPLDGQSGRPTLAQLQDGDSHHFAATYDSVTGVKAIWIDGVQRHSVNLAAGGTINSAGGGLATIGNSSISGNSPMTGTVDEVAFWNKSLTSAEVQAHSTSVGLGENYFASLNPTPAALAFNEVAQGDVPGFWVELVNYGSTTVQLAGHVIVGSENPANRYVLPAGTLAPGAFLTINDTQLGFTPADTERLFLYNPSEELVVAAAAVDNELRGRFPQADGPWLFPDAATPGAANSFEFHDEIVINEIMYHAAPTFRKAASGPAPAVPFAENEQEWIELYNRSAATVDLSDWRFEEAIDYSFPAGTTMAPGEYLVIARDPVALAALHPTIRILGGYTGQLSNSGERLLLSDANKNPADSVEWADEGRWASSADGGGSSLELRDPDADNASPEAWAASNESGKSAWKTYTFRGLATIPPNTPNPTTYNEFILTMLDSGEVLLDDISVRENPNGANLQFIQNSTFQNDAIGASPATWRVVGNHKGTVIADPTNAANKVLRLVATGQGEHLANHAETTLKNGATFETVIPNTEYEISFKAKWISGSPQVNTRLFFNWLINTTIIDTPTSGGTPGAKNSTLAGATEAAANVGPTYANFAATPVVPAVNEPVTVSVAAFDPNGVQSVSIRYSVNGGALQTAPMTLSGGVYSGTIPGQSAEAVVQFFVEGRDSLNAVSTFPADGLASRALFKVGTQTNSTTLHNLQIIVTAADRAILGASTNVMSNDEMGATVVYEGRAYYDVGVRLKGSEHGRPNPSRRGFTLQFPPDQLFRGVHPSVGLDRSGGWRTGAQFGQDEIVVNQFINAAGGVPASYNDLVYLEGPDVNTGTAILQMGRFTNVFLDSQYENGSDGTRWEYELIYTMTPNGGVEELKVAGEGPTVFGTSIRDKGENNEAYRNNFLIKNNTDRDDFEPIDRLSEVFGLTPGSAAYHAATEQTIDIDQWLRAFAAVTLAGVSDTYFNNSNAHNTTFYQRPSDGKMLIFPQDLDFAFVLGSTSPLIVNSDLSNLLTSPENQHYYYGHLHDILNTSYNSTYMTPWVNYFNTLLPGQSISALNTYISQRSAYALAQLPAQVGFSLAGLQSMTLIDEFVPAKALVPSATNGGSTLGTSWTATGFNDTSWQSGSTGVGYETTPENFQGLLNLNVGSMFNVNGSAFVRVPFNYSGSGNDLDSLTLRMKYDDGFVAYLNGTKIAEANAPTNPLWNSLSTAAHDDPQAIVFVDFNVSNFKHLLNNGQNVLAIHAMNTTLGSSDLLILPELIAEKSSAGGGELVVPGPNATVSGRGWVNVREIRLAGDPTPLNTTWTTSTAWETTFAVQPGTHEYTLEAYDFQGTLIGTQTITITSTEPQPLINHLRVSELMYHPADPSPAEIALGFIEADDFEFIELVNTSTTETLNLDGVSIGGGISVQLAAVSLPPQGRIVLVENMAAFAARYGASIVPVAQYSGQLNNSGEPIRIADAANNTILDFEYDDTGTGWHPTTDGDGYSLVIIDENGPTASWSDGPSWKPSSTIGGSPGTDDSVVVLEGDVNGDLQVDLVDLAILQSHFGITSGAARNQGDLNGDGAVNRLDAAVLARNYGRSVDPSPSAPAAVVAEASRAGREPVRAAAADRDVARRSRAEPRVVDNALSGDLVDTLSVSATARRTAAQRSLGRRV